MTEQHLKEKFLYVYDRCADDIFAQCYERISHRDVARYMTQSIFMQTWNILSSVSSSVTNIEKTLYQTMRRSIKKIISGRRQDLNYLESMWNFTLSQQ